MTYGEQLFDQAAKVAQKMIDDQKIIEDLETKHYTLCDLVKNHPYDAIILMLQMKDALSKASKIIESYENNEQKTSPQKS